jgi:dihydrodipicolinate synthase/N-acetylneuraminate lyase
MPEVKGAFAAAVTPLTDGGAAIDEGAFGGYADFLAAGGIDGVLALGSTGEGILLSAAERRRVAELFIEAVAGRFAVAVHCGAQTTAETVALAAHAAEAGADAVTVLPPAYYALDEPALLAHFSAAAAACAPLPFFLYEYEACSGYAIPVSVVERVREQAQNLRGLKISDKPWESISRYLLPGLDIFVGAEGQVARALEHGAAGAMSGVAAAYPELIAQLVHDPSQERSDQAERLLARLESLPFQAAVKTVATRRGAPIGLDVRAPLRGLRPAELALLPAL